MKISFLFWNLRGREAKNRLVRSNNLGAAIQCLTKSLGLDVLVLAECGIAEAELIEKLDGAGIGPFFCPVSNSNRVKVFTRFAGDFVTDVFNDGVTDRLTIRELRPKDAPSILLAGLHFHDRMTLPSDAGRALASASMAERIAEVENEVGHQRTILVGDFNMNPFDGGVVGAGAFHALMTKQLTKTVGRLKHRRGHRCFYNPMWNCFGDRSDGPSGTYFYDNPLDPGVHFWQIYDQVLLRPDLMENLVSLQILDTANGEPLVSRQGRPRKAVLSDHLPVHFELTL